MEKAEASTALAYGLDAALATLEGWELLRCGGAPTWFDIAQGGIGKSHQ